MTAVMMRMKFFMVTIDEIVIFVAFQIFLRKLAEEDEVVCSLSGS